MDGVNNSNFVFQGSLFVYLYSKYYISNKCQIPEIKLTMCSNLKMVAMDTSFGNRSLIIKLKTKAIVTIMFAVYRIFYNFIIRKSEKKSLIIIEQI